MIFTPQVYFGSVYGWQMFPTVAERPVTPDVPAEEGDPLERQASVANAWTCGFDKAPPPSVGVFWRMRKYSACRLAYAVTAGPIFAGTRTATIRAANGSESSAAPVRLGIGVQVTETQDEKRRKLVEDVFEDLWPDILCGLESLNFGHWLQEIIWDRRDGVTAPVRFKSFLPSEAMLLRDKFNDFAGFKYANEERDPRYAWHAVNDRHIDPIYGIPRAENAREPWWRATQTHENGDRIERKASGIQMMLEMATGQTFKDANGNPVMRQDVVQKIVDSAASGKTFTVPLTPWRKEDIQNNPDLASMPLIRVKEFDWGDTGPALLASIARLDRLDKEIFRAWHRPEREAMQGDHGTQAEAGVHGQIGIVDSELVHAAILRQFNAQVVNRFLATNFPDAKAGSIYFKPTPLADPQRAFKQEVAKALLSNPGSGPSVQAHIDARRLLKETETPLIPENEVQEPQPVDQSDPAEDENPLDRAAA